MFRMNGFPITQAALSRKIVSYLEYYCRCTGFESEEHAIWCWAFPLQTMEMMQVTHSLVDTQLPSYLCSQAICAADPVELLVDLWGLRPSNATEYQGT